jgi:hemerythrin
VNYTIYHFSTEENLMQQHGFPGTAAHRLEHNNLTVKISPLQKEHAVGKPGTAESFVRVPQQWLEEHMLKTDKDYVQFLCSKGVV